MTMIIMTTTAMTTITTIELSIREITMKAMLLSLFLMALPAAAAQPIACADLKAAVSIPDTTITLAELRPAGANPNPVGTLPVPICRVVGVTKPAVQFEVWMPSTGWNAKFQMVANGGTAAVITYTPMS